MTTSLYAEQEADFCFKGDYVKIDGTLMVSAPTGTTAGAAWTTGAPVLTKGQKYILVTAGSTAYRVPVFDNA